MTGLNYYRTIFEKAGDAIFIHDIDSVDFMDVNEAAESLTGYTKQQLTQMSVGQISAYGQGFNCQYALNKVKQAASHQAITFEWLIEAKDQTHIPVEVCLKIISIQDQLKVLALIRNISEIKKYQYQLQSKDQYFKLLLESSGDGIAILDIQGRLLYASPSLHRILGYRDRLALNKNVFSIIHPTDRLHLRQFLFKDHINGVGILNYQIPAS